MCCARGQARIYIWLQLVNANGCDNSQWATAVELREGITYDDSAQCVQQGVCLVDIIRVN